MSTAKALLPILLLWTGAALAAPQSADTAPAAPATSASGSRAGSAPVAPRSTGPEIDPSAIPDVRKYCTSVATAANEARFSWQTAKLNELESRIKDKIKELEAKQAELRDWVEKRQDIEKKAGEKLVDIYGKMRPETAASQIASLDDDMAAAVLSKLGPRQASAIFNEIPADKAAKLASIIAGATSPADKKL